MHDLIDSGIWAELSATAKTLYPVLCRFSNESFKPVWPGTDELLRLTGFKTKKSLQMAKKELIETGLIDLVQGNGRTTTRYYFRFDYKNSQIDLENYRDRIISSRGAQKYPPGGYNSDTEGSKNVTPNNINININTSNTKQEETLENIESLLKQFLENVPLQKNIHHKDVLIHSMLKKYGQLEIGEAIKIAISRGKNGDINYLEGILRNRKNNSQQSSLEKIKNNQAEIPIKEILLKKFPEHANNLEYYYSSGKVHYFTTRSHIPVDLIENYINQKGYSIKIIYSPLSIIKNKSTGS